MIVVTGDGSRNPGARYSPESNQWTEIAKSGAPLITQTAASIEAITSVWTGKEVLVWGNTSPAAGVRYNPAMDTWTNMTTVGSPKPRIGHSAIWTGDSMVVVGGLENANTPTDTTLIYGLTKPVFLYSKR